MPAKRKRRSRPGYKASYTNYQTQNRLVRNKKKKLEKHLKNNPNDIQSKEQSKVVSYKRKKPLDYWEKQVLSSRTANKRR